MRQQTCITLIILLILSALTMSAFADSVTIEERVLSDREIASAIDILAPEVGSDGDVLIKNDSLYINIRLNQPVKVYYSLYKIDPRIFGSDNKVAARAEQPTNVTDQLENTTDATEGDVETKEVVIPKILSELDKERFRTRIIADYNEQILKLEEANHLLSVHKLLILEEFGELLVDEDSKLMTYEQKQMLMEHNKLISIVSEERKEFQLIESKYNQLFEKMILDQEEVKVSEVLPYYKSEIEDIDSGKYKMVFYSDNESQKAIKVFYFTVKTSEETLEKIIDTIPEDINRIWEVKPVDIITEN